VLYGLAIEQRMKETVSEGRLFYCTSDGGFTEYRIPLDRIARESLEMVVRTIDSGVALPFLVPAPRQHACPYCDFHEVCGPYEEIRVGKKEEAPGLVRLKAMRDLA
jgi:ATP-dependent helicase/nuclease subunit B